MAKQQSVHDQMLDQSLSLVINCLNFDFIGTNPDESIEEVRCLPALPASLRIVLPCHCPLMAAIDIAGQCTAPRARACVSVCVCAVRETRESLVNAVL